MNGAWLALLAGLIAPAAPADLPSHRACEPAPELRDAMSGLDPRVLGCYDAPCWSAAVDRGLELLRAHPGDFHVRRLVLTLVRAERSRSRSGPAVLRRRLGLPSGEPADPESLVLAAALSPAPDALRFSTRALELDPGFPWAHLGRATALWGLSRDEEAAQELGLFMDACPGRFQEPLAQTLRRAPTIPASRLPVLRASVLRASRDLAIAYLPALWSLEFRLTPPSDHGQVRERLRQDVAALEQEPRASSRVWWRTLLEGTSMLDDPMAKSRVETGFLQALPCELDAMQKRLGRWMEAGFSEPGALDPNVARDHLVEVSSLSDRCPALLALDEHRFLTAARAAGISDAALRKEGDRYLDAWRRVEGDYTGGHFPPYQVAEAFLARRMDLHRIPALVAWERRNVRDEREGMPLERFMPETRPIIEYNALYKDFDMALLEGTAWLRLGKARKAAARADDASALLERLLAHPRATLESDLDLQTRCWTLRSEVAAALGQPDEAAQWAARAKAPTSRSKPSSGWEKSDEKLVPFELADLSGHVWRSSELEGKVYLMTAWSTWCAPCRTELKALQRVSERLASDPSIVILTFNMDFNPGVVEPFARMEGLRLPVLLAARSGGNFVNASLPRAYLVDRHGRIVYTLSGFQKDAGGPWEEATATLLKAVAALEE
jgi:thiol-disulfide isomerase/thioredoxin